MQKVVLESSLGNLDNKEETVMEGAVAGLILVGVLVVFTAIVIASSVALIPQAEAAVIEQARPVPAKTVLGTADLAAPIPKDPDPVDL